MHGANSAAYSTGSFYLGGNIFRIYRQTRHRQRPSLYIGEMKLNLSLSLCVPPFFLFSLLFNYIFRIESGVNLRAPVISRRTKLRYVAADAKIDRSLYAEQISNKVLHRIDQRNVRLSAYNWSLTAGKY